MNLFSDFDRTAWRDDEAHSEERLLTAPGGERVLARSGNDIMRVPRPGCRLSGVGTFPFWSFHLNGAYIGQVFCAGPDPLHDIALALDRGRTTSAGMELQALDMLFSPGRWVFDPREQIWISMEPDGENLDLPRIPHGLDPFVQCARAFEQHADDTMILPLSQVGIVIDVPTTHHGRMERLQYLRTALG